MTLCSLNEMGGVLVEAKNMVAELEQLEKSG